MVEISAPKIMLRIFSVPKKISAEISAPRKMRNIRRKGTRIIRDVEPRCRDTDGHFCFIGGQLKWYKCLFD